MNSSNDGYINATTSLDPATPTEESLVHKLRMDEQHIRALAVILSLTGGLALSFALGAGIFLYWHLREFKRRKQSRQGYLLEQQSIESKSTTTTSCCSSNNSVLSRTSHEHQLPAAESQMTTIFPPPLLLPPTDTTVNAGPSAPSAKEFLNNDNLDAPSCCPHCISVDPPPPAYTPREEPDSCTHHP